MQTLFSYEISDSEERAIFQPFVFQCSREQWRTILLTKFFTSFDGDLSADRFSIINPRASEIEIELLHFFTVTIFVNFASVWNHMFHLFYSLVFFFFFNDKFVLNVTQHVEFHSRQKYLFLLQRKIILNRSSLLKKRITILIISRVYFKNVLQHLCTFSGLVSNVINIVESHRWWH